MKRSTTISTWCLLTLAILAWPMEARPATSTSRSALAGVAALEQPVTYTETKIPLGELVQKVAEETGVALTAATDVADEPVAVVVREMSARLLLEELADLLEYRWSRRVVARGDAETRDGGVTSRDRVTSDE